MALPTNLTTNEVKDASGTEVEFLRAGSPVGRELLFIKSGEQYNLKHRLTIGHVESGTGIRMRRRSRVGFFIDSVSGVDSVSIVRSFFYTVADIPVGALTATTVPLLGLANLNSFMATTGSATTVLFDGTGYGTAALKDGTL